MSETLSTHTFKTLYKLNKNGKVLMWTVEVRNNAYRTHSSIVNGKIIISEWRFCKGKNVGRSNETLPHEQASAEALSLITKKMDSGFVESITDVNVNKSALLSPMLAKNFNDSVDTIRFPVYSQPKLDGIRCILTSKGAFSRNGKRIVSVPHILHELEPVFREMPDLILDGELYNHNFHDNFNKIVSMVKKQKITDVDVEVSKQCIEYWIYDVVDTERKFSERLSLMNHIFLKFNFESVKQVETTLSESLDVVNIFYHRYLSDNFEGQIIRMDDVYHKCRTTSLLKRKEFVTAEYIIVDIVEGEGNRSGGAGYMILKDVDSGLTFNSNIKGTFEHYRKLLANKDSLISKLATVKFFNLTPGGVPRFPHVISIRDYE